MELARKILYFEKIVETSRRVGVCHCGGSLTLQCFQIFFKPIEPLRPIVRSYYDLRTSANSDDEVVKLKKSIRWNLALFGAFFLEFVVAILDVISRFTPYGLFEMSDETYNKWYV